MRILLIFFRIQTTVTFKIVYEKKIVLSEQSLKRKTPKMSFTGVNNPLNTDAVA